MNKQYVLGISCNYHNSAAAIISDGRILFAAEEERFSRIKGDSSFPINAIRFCLDEAGIMPDNLDAVAYYEDPGLKFSRILTNVFLNMPKSFVQYQAALPSWLNNKLWIEREIKKELSYKGKILFIPHHLSHAASAFYPSPYNKAAILTVDGAGEWSCCTWGVGKSNSITIKEELTFPNSLGLLYSAFTYYTGFKINEGEYKMMGLAPYGKPEYVDLIKKELIHIAEDGSFILNQKYFSYTYNLHTINSKFEELFGKPARRHDEPIGGFYADIAASIQEITNEIIISLERKIRAETGCRNLVMAGGVALNVTTNGVLAKSKIFDSIWIAPAAGDAGGAIGAAYEAYYRLTAEKRFCDGHDKMNNAFLGYSIAPDDKSDSRILKEMGANWKNYEEYELASSVARLLSEGKVVGIAGGRAEFGPRALGHRSILADARNPKMLARLNSMIKFREGFRPFAPCVIKEDANQYFEIEEQSPYMLFTFPIKEERRLPLEYLDRIEDTAKAVRSDLPCITHIDYSARVQTVTADNNDFLYKILSEFKKLTGCSVLVNTSFNTNGEPIVNTAADAYRCFMRSGIDYAVIGNRFFDKELQKQAKMPEGGW